MNSTGCVCDSCSCVSLIVLVHLIVDVVNFVLSNFHINTAEGVDNLLKAVKVNNRITVNLDAEVCLNCLN